MRAIGERIGSCQHQQERRIEARVFIAFLA